MFSSAEELLEEDEEIKKKTGPSRFNSGHFKWFIAGILYFILLSIGTGFAYIEGVIGFKPLFLTLILPGILIMAIIETKRQFVKYYFTTNKIIKETGILNKNLKTINYENITNVKIVKPFEERIFDVGDLHIDTAGTHKAEQILNGLKDPESCRVLISERNGTTEVAHQEKDKEFKDKK